MQSKSTADATMATSFLRQENLCKCLQMHQTGTYTFSPLKIMHTMHGPINHTSQVIIIIYLLVETLKLMGYLHLFWSITKFNLFCHLSLLLNNTTECEVHNKPANTGPSIEDCINYPWISVQKYAGNWT